MRGDLPPVTQPLVVTIPQETVNDDSVRILSWKFAVGVTVSEGDLLCEVETSKAVMEIHAPGSGVLDYRAAAGESVPVGSVICEILPHGFSRAPDAVVAEKTEPISETDASALPPARLTPLAARICRELGIDPASFARGTMVRQNDVLRKAGKLPPEIPVAPTSQVHSAGAGERGAGSAVMPVQGVPVEWADLPRRKLLEAKILGGGQANSLQSSVTSVCRAAGLRSRMAGLGIGPTGVGALVIFEAGRMLRQYPAFNALHDRGRIGQYGEVNIGWAVDGGLGLVVPVIRQADTRSLREIASEMDSHLDKYVEGKLAPADLVGGTFTVTDLSGEGVSFFHPLISQGQSAILGIGSETDSGGETFHLTLAFDHQIAEGRLAARFVRELAQRVEAHGSKLILAECAVCKREASEVKSGGDYLLRSEFPAGFVCTRCIGGRA